MPASPPPSVAGRLVLGLLACLAPACSEESGGASTAVSCPEDTATTTSPDAATGGEAIHLTAVLTPDEDGEHVTFLTPALSTYTAAIADIVGKPFYLAVFPGGFDQGVDLDLHHAWGTVPENLQIEHTTPAQFADGPYDLALIVYTRTEISEAIRNDYFTVAPKAGELSAFTLSKDRILPGDPGFSNGVVRVNVQGATGELRLDNRHDPNDVRASLDDTILTVP